MSHSESSKPQEGEMMSPINNGGPNRTLGAVIGGCRMPVSQLFLAQRFNSLFGINLPSTCSFDSDITKALSFKWLSDVLKLRGLALYKRREMSGLRRFSIQSLLMPTGLAVLTYSPLLHEYISFSINSWICTCLCDDLDISKNSSHF